MPDGAVWLTPMPLFHTGGCVIAVLGALGRRGDPGAHAEFDPGLMLELDRVGASQWFAGGVPDDAHRGDGSPRCLRCATCRRCATVFSGGAQVPEALVRSIEDTLGVDFTIVYGQTECSPGLTNTFPTDTAEDKGQTVGPPLPHTELRIVDPVALETVPIGERGELWARGYFTMIGYFDKPDRDGRHPVARRLAAHRRPRDDGRARLLPHRWPAQGHDHPRRREPVPRRDRGGALPPSRRRRSRRRRPPRREVGRGRGGVHSSCGPGSPAEGRRAARAPAGRTSHHRRPRRSGTSSTSSRSPVRARSRSSRSERRGRRVSTTRRRSATPNVRSWTPRTGSRSSPARREASAVRWFERSSARERGSSWPPTSRRRRRPTRRCWHAPSMSPTRPRPALSSRRSSPDTDRSTFGSRMPASVEVVSTTRPTRCGSGSGR